MNLTLHTSRSFTQKKKMQHIQFPSSLSRISENTLSKQK